MTRSQRMKSMGLEKQNTQQSRLVEYFVVVSSVPKNETTDILLDCDCELDDRPPATENLSKLVQKEYNFEAVITSRYPAVDHENNPLLHESVVSFCHPSDEIEVKDEFRMPKVHYFVTTGARGTKNYGCCLTFYEPFTVSVTTKGNETKYDIELFLPKCICILSAHPYLVAFREYLIQLERLSKSGDMTVPLERYIANFCSEVAAPPPGSFEVQLSIADSVIKFWSPPHNQPIAWISLPFSHLFECLDIENIITLWHALALERQILIVSSQRTLLTTVCEILLSLLFPMIWSHAYIPLLPKFLVSILSAPMPFLCGVEKEYFNEALLHLSDECIVVDLDSNRVSFGPNTPSLPPLPREFRRRLNQKLNDNAGIIFREARSLTKEHDLSDGGRHLPLHVQVTANAMWESKLCLYDETFNLAFTPDQEGKNILNGNEVMLKQNQFQSSWDAVQEAFMNVYVELLCCYRQCLVFPSKDHSSIDSESTGSYGGAGFRSKEFIKLQKRDRRNFLREFVNTQMFDFFITKRLYGSGANDITFFDLAIDSHLKRKKFTLDRSLHSESDVPERKEPPASSIVNFFGKIRREFEDVMESKPLLCSSAVRQRLKTIVPPEPSNLSTSEPNLTESDDENSVESKKSKVTNDTAMSSPISSFESPGNGGIDNCYMEQSDIFTSARKFSYPVFPSKLDNQLYGTPRPLPPAIVSEFERQKENAAQFRKKGKGENIVSPEEATFDVFFITLTSIIGKEFKSNQQHIGDHNILFTEADDERENTSNKAAKNLTSVFENVRSLKTDHDEETVHNEENNHNKFCDPLHVSKLEEAKVTANAQLDLAFEMLDIMKQRGLAASPAVYKCLINACGKCGDTDRATMLLSKMHEDGIVADGVVYSCLVSAFSAENTWRKASARSEIPVSFFLVMDEEWANGASVALCVDWNKVGNQLNQSNMDKIDRRAKLRDTMRNILSKVKSVDSDEESGIHADVTDTPWSGEPLSPEKFVTEAIGNHIGFGENLLEIVYPDISIDTNDERCPQCNSLLLDDAVVSGWTPGDSQDYTTKCHMCNTKFVPKFTVQCSSNEFIGSKGRGTALICERLSPWVLEKELRIKMRDFDGIGDLLDSKWRDQEMKNAVLWWNLMLAFMRYRIPFTFLLQGNFGKNLIVPMPR